MKTIYYDYINEYWHHNDSKQSYTWGAHHIELPFHSKTFSSIPFHVADAKGKLGPVIGVLTSRTVLSNLHSKTYDLLQTVECYVHEGGGLLFLFCDQGLYHRSIHGMIFDRTTQQWIKAIVPYPDVIYNRFPSRKHENQSYMKQAFQKIKSEKIPIFNPSFFSKWEVYLLLQNHPSLKKHLPYTILFQQPSDIEQMLNLHEKIYIKPSNSSKGNGIFTLSRDSNGAIQYESPLTKSHLETIHTIVHDHLQDSSKQWILQEAISSDCIDEKRYDLRILVHQQSGEFSISGIGIRQSQTQSITTHTLNGGVIVPFSAIEDQVDRLLLDRLVNECGQCLAKQLGLIGEFSMDMVKSIKNEYYILEVNAKPMIFDEPIIQKQGMYRLLNLFYELAGFSDVRSKSLIDYVHHS
ncbi:YheC/YheD family protein [Bacillus sp. CGMCC 1.16541]|uniref:YheC/YheD family endospore coat-associated protein n=1 Tax=Bacillus sp. CGMCC 1.16541 TaxID=2185143 RepID=UPI000D7265E4|nr:YheC/YheD family protein [Bacillus sp. CGMCC 1.16541]